MYTLNRLAEEGHCYAVRQQLTETGAKLLEVEESLLSPALDQMIADRDVITAPVPESEDVAIYLPPFFYAEVGVQNRMRSIAAGKAIAPRPAQVSMREDIEYDEIQLEAIRTALKSKIMVLTGGPGSQTAVGGHRQGGEDDPPPSGVQTAGRV